MGEYIKEILAGMGCSEEQVTTMEEQFATGFAGMPRNGATAAQHGRRAQAGYGEPAGEGSDEVGGSRIPKRSRPDKRRGFSD